MAKASELPLTVNDEDRWAKAEKFVEAAMRQKKKEIIVHLLVKFARKCDDDSADSDAENPEKNKVSKVHFHLLRN